jgi:hypothetical protein
MVARAWSGLSCGTREPVAPMGRPGQWRGLGLRLVVWSENPKQLICEGESSDAGHRGGPTRSVRRAGRVASWWKSSRTDPKRGP